MKVEKFWEVWENLNYAVHMLKLFAIAEFIIILFLLIALVEKITEKKPVVVVPGAPSVMTLEPDIIPPKTIKDLGVYLITLYTSFHPANIQEHIDEILKFVNAESYGAVKKELLAQMSKVKESGYAQVFDPNKVEIKGDTVIVSGLFRSFIGGEKILEEVRDYEVVFKKGLSNSSNPYGLYIKHIGRRQGD